MCVGIDVSTRLLLLTFLVFGVVGILTATGGDNFDTTPNAVATGALATVVTLLCVRPTWSGVFEGLLMEDSRPSRPFSPTRARVEILMLVWLNILALSLWNLFVLCMDADATSPPTPSTYPLIGVLLESIYTTVFLASGIGFGSFVDHHWSVMVVSFVTTVYVSMILRPIVFAKLFNDLIKQDVRGKEASNTRSVEAAPLLRIGR